MAKAGMVIIPATDDWHMHNTDEQKCYQTMIEHFGFDLDGVRQCIENGINAAWQPEAVKERWRQTWLAEFDQLRAELIEESTFDPDFHTPYRLHGYASSGEDPLLS